MVTAEELARRIYFIREALAPEYGQPTITTEFDDLPEEAKSLLIATSHFVLEELHDGPKCPHLRTVLRRVEVRQCVDCGVYDPSHQEKKTWP